MEAPNHLAEEAKAIWRETAEAQPAGFFTHASEQLLESYCVALVRQRALEKAYADCRRDYPDDTTEHERFERRIDQAARRVRTSSDKLGLTGRSSKAKKKQKRKHLPPHLSLNRQGKRVPYLSEDAELYQAAVAALEGTERSESALRSQVLKLVKARP